MRREKRKHKVPWSVDFMLPFVLLYKRWAVVSHTLEEDVDFSGMARRLYIPDTLLGFKLSSMKEKGYKGIVVPVVSSGFLRDM